MPARSQREPAEQAVANRLYDKHRRNPQAAAFYKSAAWQAARVAVLARDYYLCQPCLGRKRLTPADAVHHLEPLEKAPERALDMDNLESICHSCHNKEHPEKGRAGTRPERPRRVQVIVSQANPEVV